jgi:general secretion pathway protein A
MYLKYFQLNTKPFQITADPKFLWMGEKHKEALATLRYGILDNRGFLLLTGEVGTGKTILINRLTSMLEMDTVVASLPDPDLISMDFYNLLADSLKMNRTFDSKGAFLIHLRDFLHKCYADRKQVLLIIDECQRLNHPLLEDIRVLSNIELQDRKLINIFFVGQQEFNATLSMPKNRALAQRITVRYHISPLEVEEVGDYIRHRLKVAGTTQKIFNAAAVGEVYAFSGGIPRLINIICDHAMLTAYARGAKVIDDHIIKECAEELRIPPFKSIDAPDFEPLEPTPDTRAITNAVAKSAGKSKPISTPGVRTKSVAKAADKVQRGDSYRSPVWKFFFAGILILLVSIAATLVLHFTNDGRPVLDAEERAPQGFRTGSEQGLETSTRPMGESSGSSQNTEKKATDTDVLAEQRIVSPTAPSAIERDPAPAPAVRQPSLATIDREPPLQRNPERVIGELEPLPLIKEKLTIHFKLNSNEIDDESYDTLDRIALFLKQNPGQRVSVRGYTDSTGAVSYNQSISQFRANAVKSYLVGKGARPERLQVYAMGPEDPIASNETVEGRRLNRRVEIDFLN